MLMDWPLQTPTPGTCQLDRTARALLVVSVGLLDSFAKLAPNAEAEVPSSGFSDAERKVDA